VSKLKRSVVLGTVLAFSLAVIIACAAVAPTIANSCPTDPATVTSYGTSGTVILQLPPGTPSHPTNLKLGFSDFEKRSHYGGGDALLVELWVPQANRFVPVAAISDNPNPDLAAFNKMVWNNTPIWMTPLMPNCFNVTDKDLEVTRDGDTLTANLTKTVHISLPFNLLIGTPYAAWGNLTFDLPPLTLMFRGIDDPFRDEKTYYLLPKPPLSGYTLEEKRLLTPAWVRVEIPAWLGTTALEVVGHIDKHLTMTYIPPAP
jgi:hypothetical protein